MSREDLKDVIYEVLVACIAERVAEKIALYNKRALVVFTGSLLNADQAMEQLRRLRQDGFQFHVCLSESAASLLNLSQIREVLQPEEIYQDNSGKSGLPEQLAREFETIIVPTMTINTAAKLACCIADTPASRLISNAMMRGKNVIIGIDGCCPDNKERAAKGYQMREPLKEQLRDNMRKMASYGAYLTTLENLYDSTKKKVLHQGPGSSASGAKKVETSGGTGVNSRCGLITGKVIGKTDILLNAGCKVIKISKDALVTKLAEETARENKIQLIRE
ncbi:hypothetical protein Ami103574_07455 [Aminipila butyrica]|uniref:Flavoprotein domain-containing protein n=1 Tax=Aminipila butyrica TaxID=433296 RepID=A0A858BYM0_9FIRM|nr:flavoprotein [Aminipila butyrica]QIB69166.1 hypothetical protein Ami103574_07455 [Aminipila butyrica]